MALQSPQLPHPPTPLPVTGAADLELLYLSSFFLVCNVHVVLPFAVRAYPLSLPCIIVAGEAGETTVIATANKKVSIIKHIFTDEADVLVRNGVYKLIVISIVGLLVTGGRKNIIINYISPLPSFNFHFLSHTIC